jgi:alpha-beta hydrolase superfamily lysophospholipase
MDVAAWFSLWFLLPTPPKEGGDRPEITQKHIFGVDRAIDIADNVFPSEKVLAELECGIDGCEHGWLDSCFEGAKLHYRKWVPPNGIKAKGIVIWLHGIAAHSGRALVLDDGKRKLGMALQCECWVKAGYALYALDYYGHGYSEGVRFYVPSFEVNRDDIIAFSRMAAAEHEENTPIFLEGESYGGCLALHVAKVFQDKPTSGPKGFRGIMLQAPAIIPPDLPPRPVVALLTSLSRSYPTWIPFFMPNPVSTDRIWRDKQVLQIFDSKERREIGIEGGGKPFRLATAVGMLEAMRQLREDIIPNLTVPFCVSHGDEDCAVPMVGTEFLLKKAATPENDRAFQRLPGAYHDLMSDPVAQETLDFMIQFADKHIAA